MGSLPILLCVAAIALGQVLFKLAAARVEAGAGVRALLVSLLLNPPLLLALAVYGATTVGWVWLLKDRDLSTAYPLFGLSFVFVAGLGRLVFGEPLTWSVFVGTALIVAGVAVITACR